LREYVEEKLQVFKAFQAFIISGISYLYMTVRTATMIIKTTYRVVLFLLITVLIFDSCSTLKDTPCPDFSNNKSYSKKYISDSRYEKKQKNCYARKYHQNGLLMYNKQKNSYSNLKDFTINSDKTYK
jgi:hypothetical protein